MNALQYYVEPTLPVLLQFQHSVTPRSLYCDVFEE